MELYWRLPVFMQEAALSAYAMYLEKAYYGPGYEEWRQWFQRSQRWSRPDVEAWQSERLRELIEIAATHVPYYRRHWQNVDWRSVSGIRDLHRLPVLGKESVKQREVEFLVEGVDPKSLWMDSTSGTTGSALRIYQAKSVLPQWWALVEVAIRNVAAVSQDLPRAMMGSRTIVKGDASRPPYWRYNRRWRQLYLSSYHISKRTAADYAGAITRYAPEWITGYGSAIAAFAQSAMEAGIEPLRLRAAIVSGDTLQPGMRRSIETFFNCKCFDSYGQCECVAVAMECPEEKMHVVPTAGILEILREDGSPCGPGEVGEIVGTGLVNDVMPLIRYKVGDYAAWAEDQNCTCGNQQPIITNLEGRVDDYVVTKDGRKIGRLAAFRRGLHVHAAQLVQDSLGHAFLLVRPGVNYTYQDAVEIRGDIQSRVGGLDVEIIEVPEIPKSRAGKMVTVVRLFDRPELHQTYEELLGTVFRRSA